MATANDFAVANSYLPPKKPVLGQNELAVWDNTVTDSTTRHQEGIVKISIIKGG